MEVIHDCTTFSGAVTATHSGATLQGAVTAAPRDPTVQPLLQGAVSGAVYRAVTARRLVYRWKVTWDGVEIPAGELVFPISVVEQRGGIHSWAFGVRIRRDGTSAIGRLVGGKMGMCRKVTISIVLHTDQGAREIVMLQDGIVRDVGEQLSPPAIRLSGTGPGGRYDQAKAGVLVPRGSLRTRGSVAAQVLASAGVPASQIAIAPGAVITKVVNAELEEPMSLVNDLLYPELRACHWVPATGILTTAPLGRLEGGAAAVATAAHLLADQEPGASTGEVAQGPTGYRVTSTQQLTDPDCGEQTTIKTVTILRIMTTPLAVASYDSAGQVVPFPFTFVGPRLLPYQRTVISETHRCGKLVYRRTGEWEWFRGAQVWKAQLDTDGSVAAVNTRWMYEQPQPTPVGGTEIDPTPMYENHMARFRETTVTHEYWDYADGQLQRRRKLREGWRNTRLALKHRNTLDAGIPWEELPYIANARLLANGHRVGPSGREEYRRFIGGQRGIESEEVEISAAGGFIEREETAKEGWGLFPGSAWWFGGDLISLFETEIFTQLEQVTETFAAQGEAAHQRISVVELPTQPNDPRHGQVTIEEESGSLPAVPTLEIPEGGVAAPADATQRIEAAYDLSIDPECRAPRIETVEVEFAENTAELVAVGRHLGDESLKLNSPASLLLNPTVCTTRPLRVEAAPFLAATLHPTVVEHSQADDRSIPVTRVEADIYAD